MAAPAPGVLVIGAGLAGSLLALELRQRGAAVTLLEVGEAATASAFSYGGLPGWAVAPTPLARQAAGAARQWRRLQQRHGDLGWRRCGLRLHGSAGSPLARWLPFSRVDSAQLTQRLPDVLAAAGVALQRGVADRLSREGGLWRVDLAGGAALTASTLVLAAGAGCRRLWPDLPPQWRLSWAGVLELPQPQANCLTLPQPLQRPQLERLAPQLSEPRWLVDAGLAPWGKGGLLGQISLVRPGLESGDSPPPPALMEQWLRQGLEPLGSPFAAALAAAGHYRQVGVAFCSDGQPLVGPLAGQPGLWIFSGFSGAFAQVPVLAPLLADWLAGEPSARRAAPERLRRLVRASP
jgi:glycine/D-amino acid oxidase-like deaminating enzyme